MAIVPAMPEDVFELFIDELWQARKKVSKNDEFCIKNEVELCIKNEELCIKNEEFCI